MYKSPIEVVVKNFQMQMENDIYKAVREFDIDVDKEELLKALEYDRNQYERGYYDGLEAGRYQAFLEAK